MKLRKPLQAGELVEHKPDPFLTWFGFIQQPQDEQINPHALQRTQRLALRRERGNKDPSLPILGPLCGGPFSIAFALQRQQPKTFCNLTQRCKNADSLRAGGPIDIVRDLCSCHSIVDFLRIAHPLNELLRRGSVAQQMRKNLLRDLDKKLPLFILWRLKKRDRESVRFRAPTQL